MLTDRVLFTGTSSVSHPVLDHLFGGCLEPAKGDVASHVLVVIDARLGTSDLGEGAAAHKALSAGVPVLILSPGEGQLEPLASLVGATPKTAMQAVFIAPNANRKESTRFEATTLGYPAHAHVDDARDDADTRPAGDASGARPKEAGCGCGKRCAGGAGETAVALFCTRVESRLTRPYNPAALTIPDGLKYFQTSWTPIQSFTSDRCFDDGEYCFANGQGSLTISYAITGFLNQTASANSQYLIIEATYNLNPGTLSTNDDEGRGFLNTRFQSSVGPTASGFAPVDHIPTNGENTWNESFSINISYRDPLSGGYQIYTYTANVTQAIDSWSVQNASTGASSGSMWFINSPVNGSNISDTFKDAFTGDGHVEPFPSASTGTVTMKEASAWLTNTIHSGNVTIANSFLWDEDVFFSTGCGLWICYSIHRRGLDWSWYPAFVVSFSAITPS